MVVQNAAAQRVGDLPLQPPAHLVRVVLFRQDDHGDRAAAQNVRRHQQPHVASILGLDHCAELLAQILHADQEDLFLRKVVE